MSRKSNMTSLNVWLEQIRPVLRLPSTDQTVTCAIGCAAPQNRQLSGPTAAELTAIARAVAVAEQPLECIEGSLQEDEAYQRQPQHRHHANRSNCAHKLCTP